MGRTRRERLSSLDVSFLYVESPTTPMHLGGMATFAAPAGFDYDRLAGRISARLASVPRYRQRLRFVPGRLANPVWVDDPDFDVGYHVRRISPVAPLTDEELRDLVGRIQAQPLDRSRPLWEMYVVEGLEAGRFAIITKTHHAVVDGVGAVDVNSLILDPSPEPGDLPPMPHWRPAPEPSASRLVVEAVADLLRAQPDFGRAVGRGVTGAARGTGGLLPVLTGFSAAVRAAIRRPPRTPLNPDIGGGRRFGTARTALDDYKRVRNAHGGTINDVVLATVSGALRHWLLSRGEPVPTQVRALVPMSVRVAAETGRMGNRVSGYLVELPVGEPDPLRRLAAVSAAMTAHKEAGQSMGASVMIALAGLLPPPVHALGARTASAHSRRMFNLAVSNIPGPQFPLYAAGARMLDAFPLVPLLQGQAVSIGVTSYDGGVYYGLNADRDAMPDVDQLAVLIEQSLAELARTG